MSAQRRGGSRISDHPGKGLRRIRQDAAGIERKGIDQNAKKRLIQAALILLCAMMLCFAGACRNPKNDGETETEAPTVAAETGAEQPAQSEPSTEAASEAPSEPESETTPGTDDEKNWTPFY